MSITTLSELRIRNAKNLVNSISNEYLENLYLFLGRAIPWADSRDPSISDNNPPRPENNLSDNNKTRHQMLYLEKIALSRVYHMIPRNTWTPNTVYDMFRNDYSTSNVSATGESNLYDTKFVVINDKSEVYVCLYNGTSPNNPTGVVSRFSPNLSISALYEPFFTDDGYQWLYLYTLNSTQIIDSTKNLFSIGSYYGYSIPGQIYTVIIDFFGSGYRNTSIENPNVPIQYFYCNVVGDGSGAVARLGYKEGIFNEVRIVAGRYGSGYTYANLNFTSLNIYSSLSDLDANRNPISLPYVDSLKTTCVISPQGGWGSDLITQLGGTRIGIFLTLGEYSSNYLSTGNNTPQFLSIRQSGIINNVRDLSGVKTTSISLSGSTSVRVKDVIGRSYQILEVIEQTISTVNGIDRVAKGTVTYWDEQLRVLKYFQDPNMYLDQDGNLWPFQANGNIIGQESGTSSVVDTSPTDSPSGFVNGFEKPDFDKNSGEIIFISNFAPIDKTPRQKEIIYTIFSY